MLGFSKAFSIVCIVALFFSLGMRTHWIGLQIIAGYAIIKIFWNILRLK